MADSQTQQAEIRPEELEPSNVQQATLIRVVQMQHDLADTAATVTKIDETVHGNGKLGLTVRVDRLEQRDKSRTWGERLIFGALASGSVGFVILLVQMLIKATGGNP